eukprot:762128-Prymnesium_polylepis.2
MACAAAEKALGIRAYVVAQKVVEVPVRPRLQPRVCLVHHPIGLVDCGRIGRAVGAWREIYATPFGEEARSSERRDGLLHAREDLGPESQAALTCSLAQRRVLARWARLVSHMLATRPAVIVVGIRRSVCVRRAAGHVGEP